MTTALSAGALPKFHAMQARSDRLAVTNEVGVTRKQTTNPRFSRGALPAEPWAITQAILGNHVAVQGFLQRTRHRPNLAEFNASTARPGYVPGERFLVRTPEDRGLVAHVQVEPQVMRFGRVDLPIARIRDLSVLPEYERQGLGHRLLTHAEQAAQAAGSMLAIAHGEPFRLLRRQGWTSIGSDPVSTVSPQRLMGQLPSPPEPESPFFGNQLPKAELQIARLTDAARLQALYEQSTSQAYGAAVRTEDYWSWLMKKGSHSRIYLYLEDDHPLAYVVMRGADVLELVDVTTDQHGAARLLERVSADAIEQGRHTIRIHAPFSAQAHAWADLAGGGIFVAGTEESWMVKILSWRNLIRRLAVELHRRVRSSTDPIELGIRIGSEAFLIRRGVRSMRITRGSSTHQIEVTGRAATQLVLGYRSVDELMDDKLLVASTDTATAAARALFPPVDLWHTQWDDVA